MKLFEIKPNTSGKVRTTLHIEDVQFKDLKVLLGFDIIIEVFIKNGVEKVLYFKEPFRVPRFNKFYASRITDIDDPYLYDLIDRILYLNPNPDKLLIKKITEFIILKFSRIELKPSEVSVDTLVPMPVLVFEDVVNIVTSYAKSGKWKAYHPDTEDVVLFPLNSTVTKQEKISLKASFRAYKVQEHLEKAIHTVTEHLIDTQELIKVTHSGIEGSKLVTTDRGLASVRTIRKYMSERTKRVIDEHNIYAPFRSLRTYTKYKEYIKMPIGISMDEIADELNISKSTVIKFRKVSELLKE